MSYPDRLPPRTRIASVLLALASVTCLQDPGFVCEEATQCLAADAGVCTSAGHCAYPDDDCASRLRYGESAPTGFAGICVGEEHRDPPESLCGNGVVDELEDCDDHNREAGDACHPQCVEPGTVLWTVRYDGEAHGEDKGYGIAVDEESETFYVSGFTTVVAAEGQDTLVQRRWIETGELIWSKSAGGAGRVDDSAENVAVDGNGDVVAAGGLFDDAAESDAWLRKYGAEGDERWTVKYDDQHWTKRGDGVAVLSDGTVVIVGTEAVDRGGGDWDPDAWIARYDGAGTLLGEPVLVGTPGLADNALDATADRGDLIVTGNRTDPADGESTVWTARFGSDGVMAWEDLARADLIGNAARGVGVGCDHMGICGTAGVLSNDIWVRLYDEAGTPLMTITEHGPGEMHDEAADIAFVGDGSFVVVGFMDYAVEGWATGDCWVAQYAADGTQLWSDVNDGPANEIDKALAVEVTSDRSALVTGYETVPGQERDVWIRRYAI